MGNLDNYSLQIILSQPAGAACDYERYLAHAARRLYDSACLAAWLRGLWLKLICKPNRLRALNDAGQSIAQGNGFYAGIRAVPLTQIRGSENRLNDFDANFNPLRHYNQGRWLSVATARLCGVALPPVELIQVGDTYYVRDGHHRISVGRAMGQEIIDAEVVIRANASAAPVSNDHLRHIPQSI